MKHKVKPIDAKNTKPVALKLTKEQKEIESLAREIIKLKNSAYYAEKIIEIKTHIIELNKESEKRLQTTITKQEEEIKELKNPSVNKFNPCSVCREECPFKTLSYERKQRLCIHADILREKHTEATKNLNNPVFINGNKHLYSWLTKPVEIPEAHEDWLISLKVFSQQHNN
jgi:hypothetical protein